MNVVLFVLTAREVDFLSSRTRAMGAHNQDTTKATTNSRSATINPSQARVLPAGLYAVDWI